MNRKKLLLISLLVILCIVVISPTIGSDGSMIYSNPLEQVDSGGPNSFPALAEDPVITYSEFGKTVKYPNGSYVYTTSVGEENTWDTTEDNWKPYKYNSTDHSVQIGKFILKHLPNGRISLERTGVGAYIESIAWYAQYHLNGIWNNFTFDNYSFDGVELTENTVTAYQRWWSVKGELNASWVYTNHVGIKIRALVTNKAAIEVPVRVIWGLDGIYLNGIDFEIIKAEDNTPIGVMFANSFQIIWDDVIQNTPEIPINTYLNKVTRTAGIVFGNLSTTLAPGETMDIDPVVYPQVSADGDDATGDDLVGMLDTLDYISSHDLGGIVQFWGFARWAVAIPQGYTVTVATFQGYKFDADFVSANIVVERINEDNCAAIEGRGATNPSLNNTNHVDDTTSAGAGPAWDSPIGVTAMVQDQINIGGWSSGDYMGIGWHTNEQTNNTDYEDSQGAEGYGVKLSISYAVPTTNDACSWNWDDTDNIYAMKEAYALTVDVSSNGGVADDIIDVYVDLYDENTLKWTVWYDESGDSFQELGGGYSTIDLISGSDSDIDADTTRYTIYIKFNWTHIEEDDLDMYVRSGNEIPTWTKTWFNDTTDVITTLYFPTGPAVTDDDAGTVDRGDLDEAFIISGTVAYYQSGGNDYPPNTGVDMWSSCPSYGTTPGPFSDLELSSGVFAITCYADDAVGSDIWTIKPVIEAAGSGGSSLLWTTDPTDTYISDSLTATLGAPTDSRINIGDTASMAKSATYDYGGAFDGTLTLNDTTLDHGVVGTYGYKIASASADTHGVTGFSSNSDERSVIFDALTAYVSVPDDQRIDIGDNCTGLVIWAIYESDNSAYDGALTLNDTTYNYDVVDIYYYNVTIADGLDTYGITVITNNGNQTYCIFDALIAYVSPPTDQRINIGANASGMVIWANYSYDDTIYDGSLTLNDTTYDYGSVDIYYYNVTIADGLDTYGITVISNNGNQTYCIFDSLTAYVSPPTDQRIDIGANASGMVIWANYSYDNTAYGGDLTLNDTTYNYGSVDIYYYNVTIADGLGAHGITVVNNGGNQTYCIFDALIAYVSPPTDQRIDIGANATGMIIWAIHDYDSAAYTGALTLNDTTYDHSVVDIYYYNVTIADGLDTYGITVILNTGNQTYCIFDSLIAYVSPPTDQRIDINANASGMVLWANYSYDSAVYDGALTLNDTTYDYGTVDIYYYNVTIADGLDTYGITVISNTGNQTYCIFDRIEVYDDGCDYTDIWGRVNVGQNVTLWASARLQYDNHALGSGDTIHFGDEIMTWNGTHLTTSYVQSTVGLFVYALNVSGSSEATYGITVGVNNPVNLIFDRILIYDMWLNATYCDPGEAVRVWTSLVSEHDNSSMGVGLVQLNGTLGTEVSGNINMTFSAESNWYNDTTIPTYGNWTFIITWANWTTYNLTGINYNGWNITYLSMAADRIQILTTAATDDRIDYATTTTLNVTAKLEYNGHTLGTGDNLYINGTLMTWDVDHFYYITSAISAVTSYIFTVNITGGYEATYGITTVNVNGQTDTVIWDRVIWTAITTNTTDVKVASWLSLMNLNEYIIIYATLAYEFDSTPVNDGTVSSTLGGWTYNGTDGDWYRLRQQTSYAYTTNVTHGAFTLSGNTHGITVFTAGAIGVTNYVACTRISESGGYTTNDTRMTIGEYVRIQISLKTIDQANQVINTGTAFLTDGTSFYELAWNVTAGKWEAYISNASVVGHQFRLHTNASDVTWGLTTSYNSTYQLVVWDQIKVMGYNTNSTDDRDNINTVVNVSVWIQYDYDDTNVMDGTIVINGDSYAYNAGTGNWTALFQNATVSDATWNMVVAAGNTWGITAENQNGQSQTYVWDQLIVLGYNTDNADDRDNINTEYNVSVWIQYDYDDTNVTDGTIVINGDSYAYNAGTGNWTALFQNATVSDATWNTVVASGNTYVITDVNQNTMTQEVIWDQLIVLGYNTNSTDNRDDISDYFNVSVWIQYDYDDTNVTDGTIVINGDSYAYMATGNWTALFVNATVSDATWNTVVASGNTHGITSVNQNSKSQKVIWDQILVLGYGTNSTDNRDNINTVVNITVWIYYDYDDTNVTDGTITISGDAFAYIGSGGNWSAIFMNSTASDGNWTTVVVSGVTYDITSVNQNNKYQLYIWDRVIATVAVNTTWTICYYATNVSYTGIYEYDSISWVGYSTVANTSLTTGDAVHYEDVIQTSVENYTFYITAVEDAAEYYLTSFTTTTVWCVWDNISTAYVDYYTTVSPYTKTLNIAFDQLYFQYNSSLIGTGWVCYSYRNSTAVSLAITSSGSYLSPYWQEIPVPLSWNYVLYSNNATKTVNGVDYNFQWYSLTVAIKAQLIIRNLLQELLDDAISVSGTINTNVSYTVYNEDSETSTGNIDVDAEGIEEGFKITFVKLLTIGQHNFSIKFVADSSVGLQWFNQSYQIFFNIDIEIPEQKGTQMEVKGTSNLDCSWYVYNRDDADWTGEDGSITGGNDYFQYLFVLETAAGMHNYSLYFNVSSSVYVWKNGTYFVDTVYGYATVTLYDGQSRSFTDKSYKMYINGTRAPSMTFYNRTDYAYNLTFTDYFGYTVSSAVYDYDRFIDIEIDVYTFKVYSMVADSEYFYFNLTRTGGASYSQHILPSEVLTYRLIAGTYTYDFKRINGANYDYYTGDLELSADTSYVIDDIGIAELWQELMRDIGGRANIKPVMASLSAMSGMLTLLQASLWGIAALIIGMMVLRGYFGEDVTLKDGKIVKKKKRMPKQLERFSFRKGAKNPKFKGIPKGTGQKAWGTTFEKEDDKG